MAKRKVNTGSKLKNWRSNLIWTAAMLAIAGLLFMAIERKKNAQVSKIAIGIKKIKGGKNLVSQKGIKTMFNNYLGYSLDESTISDLDLMDMEAMLEKDDRIKGAEVYVDNKDRLFIIITQREPIVRVMNSGGSSYYLDVDGKEIPAYRGSTIRVPIVSGNIEKYDPELLTSDKSSNLKDVFTLSKFIHEDEFLSALIEQINVEDNNEVILIPKLGRQKLDFGTVEDVEARFEKLKLMYREGMEHVGWRKYNTLTLKYDLKEGKDGKDRELIFGTKNNERN